MPAHTLQLVEALPDSQLTKEAEEAARVRACSMFSQSVLAYQKVRLWGRVWV